MNPATPSLALGLAVTVVGASLIRFLHLPWELAYAVPFVAGVSAGLLWLRLVRAEADRREVRDGE